MGLFTPLFSGMAFLSDVPCTFGVFRSLVVMTARSYERNGNGIRVIVYRCPFRKSTRRSTKRSVERAPCVG